MTRTVHAAPLTVLNAMSVTAFYGEVTHAMYELRWMLLAVAALVAVDFITGLTASVRIKGEDFRFSRAGRRTFAKYIEYYGYLILGVVLGKSVMEPLGLCGYVTCSAVCTAFAALWEIDSILGHVCDLHGVRARFSVKRVIIFLIKSRDRRLGEAVEDVLDGGDSDKGDNGNERYNGNESK